MVQAIDLDLFINAIKAGGAYGQSTPSVFSQVVDGLDEEAKMQAIRQQNEIRQNQINQLPVQNRIEEARAVQTEASVAAIQADPAAAQQLAIKTQQNQLAEAQREQRLNEQEAALQNVLTTGNDQQRYEALTGGAYTELFSRRPSVYTASKTTVADWSPEYRDMFYRNNDTQRRLQGQKLFEQKAEEMYNMYYPQAMADPNLASLARELGTDVTDILQNGELLTDQERPKQVTVYETKTITKDGKEIISTQRDLDGNKVAKRVDGKVVTTEDPSGATEIVDLFRYKRPDGTITEKRLPRGADYTKLYSNAKTGFDFMNGLQPGQPGGDRTTAKVGEENDKKKAEAQAAEIEAANASAAKAQVLNNNFTKSANDVIARDRNVVLGVSAARAAANAVPTATPTAIPMPVPNNQAAVSSGALPPNAPLVITPLASRTPNVSQANAASIAGTPVPPPTGTPIPVYTPAQAATPTKGPSIVSPKQMDIAAKRKAENKALADQFIQKANPTYQPTLQPIGLIPEQFEVLTPVKQYSPDIAERVANRPELKNASALVKAVAAVESGGKPMAVSNTGVRGLMQVTEAAAKDMLKPGEAYNPYNAEQSTTLGTMYLEAQLRRNRDPMLALLAYNAGPGTVATAIRMAVARFGDSSWASVSQVIPDAIAERFPKWSKTQQAAKAVEAYEYPQKVINYFPAFAQTADDMKVAEELRRNNLITYT
jgi:soluble lytic murein transglycosylase-like protein